MNDLDTVTVTGLGLLAVSVSILFLALRLDDRLNEIARCIERLNREKP